VGRVITYRETGHPAPPPFRYFDKGNMAVIGRGFAVLDSRVARLSGLSAWLAWAFIHLMFLPASGNRVRVWTQWLWSYLTRQRSSQLIVEHKAPAPLDRHNQEDKQEVYEHARVQSN